MLNSLVIKNFRMLEDFTVEKLGRVNLIVGKNNSGKSTVLEALRIYAGNANPELLKSIAESHDEAFTNDVFYPNYKNNDKNIIIGHTSVSSLNVTFGRVPLTPSSPSLPPPPPSGSTLKKISHSFIPTQFISMEELESEWRNIELTDDENIVTQALQIIVPNFQRLSFEGKILVSEASYYSSQPIFKDKPKLWVKVKLADLSKPVPLKSLGDGMLRILQIAIKLVSAQGGFLLIDEFENGLHYSVQENVWRLLFEMAEKLDIQVFATTHSWDCIESFITVAQQKPEADAVLFRMGRSVRKSNEGQVIATIFSGEELGYITQSNMEIR